jgi:hypothetical protein
MGMRFVLPKQKSSLIKIKEGQASITSKTCHVIMFAIFFFKRNSSSVVRATYIFKITIAGQLRVTPQLTKPWVAGSNPACFAKIGAVNVKIAIRPTYIYYSGQPLVRIQPAPQIFIIIGQVSFTSQLKKN